VAHVASRLSTALRSLGSLLPRRRTSDRSRVVRPWREDALRSYPTVGITPARMLALLQAADAGAPQAMYELFGEMLQRWPRLAAVEATRRLALTGLDWEVVADERVPAALGDDARRAAEFCHEALSRVDAFRGALGFLANAIGHGVAVAELVWEDGRLVDITPTPFARLAADPNEPWRVRVRTEEEQTWGVPVDAQPFKWITHCPQPTPGRPFDGGLLRASSLLFLAQNLSFKDWLIYSQIAGMPVRVGRFEPGTPEEDKRKLLEMLKALGTDAVAILAKNMELQFVEAARGGDKPYQPIQDYCNTEITILWLGQHLTTDIRNTGSRAAAEIHDRVREDLLVDDMADEAETIRRDVLRPMTLARFGADTPTPRFRRALIQSVDTKVLADTLAVAVEKLGLRPSRRWAHRALGIPEPSAGEPTLGGGTLS